MREKKKTFPHPSGYRPCNLPRGALRPGGPKPSLDSLSECPHAVTLSCPCGFFAYHSVCKIRVLPLNIKIRGKTKSEEGRPCGLLDPWRGLRATSPCRAPRDHHSSELAALAQPRSHSPWRVRRTSRQRLSSLRSLRPLRS